MIRLFISSALLFALSLAFFPAPVPAQGSPLVGLWKAEKRFEYGGGIVQVLGLSPDGRYAWVQDANGEKAASIGTYSISGSQIVFQEHYHKPEGGPYSIGGAKGSPLAVDAALQGGTLVLQGPLFAALAPEGGGAHFTKEAGSEQAVVESIRQSDELERQNNAAWRARISVGQVQPGPGGGATIPADPQPGRIFSGANVFARAQMYSYVNVTRQHVIQGDTEGGRDCVRFFFFPNGRVCGKWVTYPLDGPAAGEAPKAVRVQVSAGWGRYSILSEDSLLVESDKGERLQFKLADGRRNLAGGLSVVLTQHDWLMEILEGRAK